MDGVPPAKFTTYAHRLLKFSRENKFRYPAKPWPSSTKAAPAAGNPVVAGSAHA
jgi:hypothetical protein